jgi:predicted PurR-regulated permease PerM
LTILAWLGVAIVVLWLASHIVQSLVILAVALLLSYALMPLVRIVGRVLPRPLAVLLVTLVVLGGIGSLVYFVANAAVQQSANLLQYASTINTDQLANALRHLGVTQAQLDTIGQQFINAAQGILNDIVPVIFGTLGIIVDLLVTIVLAIYFMLAGNHINTWLRTRPPTAQRQQIAFFLDTMEQVVGGYVRGQLVLSLLIGILVGVGMTVLHVPYAILLGVLAFVLEFIPYLGTISSGVICVLVALTQGWLLAVIVLAYFIFVHIIEGYVVGPRIVGRAVGLHPAVSLFALIAAAELFGPLGALFAAPVAGLIQALVRAVWVNWRAAHPDAFVTAEMLAPSMSASPLPATPQE